MQGQIDNFVTDNLPEKSLWPEIIKYQDNNLFPAGNAVELFVDRWSEEGHGDRPALRTLDNVMSYDELLSLICRYARVLVEDFGVVPGSRVLLRGRNTPKLAALHLAVIRAGGVVVSTMPLLRAAELSKIIRKGKISHAVCEADLVDDLAKAHTQCPGLKMFCGYCSSGALVPAAFFDIDSLAERKADWFEPVNCGPDWPALIAFTSGTTGEPKGTVHTHGDLLAICDTFSAHILNPKPDDIFCGTPPLAFTFGLGGLVLFPLRAGASALLLAGAKPADFVQAIATIRPTICFTAPTAYRAMLEEMDGLDLSSLRACVSAGEHLPKATFEAFAERTGLKIIDGIGSTEMLHIFISSVGDDIRPGATGKPIPGFQATILDDEGNELPPGQIGRLAVKGPTGCRYLDDDRQGDYVVNGWNVTGDAFVCDEDGYYWYQSRMDDMIISSGYNIAAPEVENAVLMHPAVSGCAVVGVPDDKRGSIVKAFVVLRAGAKPSHNLVKELQDYVKAEIAPYKYPRQIEFIDSLPMTLTGKLKRFELRLAEAA